jgi:hypothetical protein
MALALYEAEMDEELGGESEYHRKRFGNPRVTIDATRQRVTDLMIKKGIELL